MRIGDLKKVIDIQAPTRISDGAFGFTETFTTLLSNVYAAIWPVSANETIEGQKNSLFITHKIRIRYLTNIRSGYRIKYNQRYFNIESIVNVGENNRFLDLLCKEVA